MSASPIAVVGENLVDLLVSPTGEVQAVIGGGPLNVARTLGRLGAEVYFLSGVSADAFGGFVREALADSAVRLVPESPANQPTTLAVVEMDPAGPRYHFHLANTAAFSLDEAATRLSLDDLGALAAIYVGTLGLVVEPMATMVETLVSRVAAETLVVLDPNCRPSAVTDHHVYHARVRRLSARADFVKVSTEDLDYLFPDVAALDGARRLSELGASCVVVTDGAGPVRALVGGELIGVPVAPVSVADTVGAGDALVGGLLRWWTGHGLTRAQTRDARLVGQALAAAVDISRLTCERPGAQPPRREDVANLEGWRWL